MTDRSASDAALATPVERTRRRRLSLVWFMPLLALLVAGYVVWSNYNDRGPLITITFQAASGIRAGATEVRIRDLRVGLVEEVGFSLGMEAVEAKVRIDKNMAQYLDADAQFWLVQPEVTARGVSGIGTLLSGVYIAATWDGEIGPQADQFTALPVAPLSTPGEAGTRVVLRTRAGGQLAAGAPVLASGIEVGRIGQPVLSNTGATVTMEAFISAPYDQRLTTNARFWDASGISVNVGASGVAVKVNSLAALLEGGVTFGTPVTGGEKVEDGHIFDVFATEAAARADAFEDDTARDIRVSLLLDSDVNGLGVGTVVRFRGVKVGEVSDVVGVAPPEGSDEAVKLRIDADLSPTRLGFPKNLREQSIRDAFAVRVSNGLRLRVASEGLFGQTVILELINLPNAVEAEVVELPAGRMLLPTVPAAISNSGEGVDGLVSRVQNLPIEELMVAATGTLNGVTQLAGSAEALLASPGVTNIPKTVDETLSDIRDLVADVTRDGAVAALIANAASALEDVKELTGTANGVLGTAQGVLSADGMDRIPQTVEETLSELRTLLADVSGDGKAAELVASATKALDGVTELTGSAQAVLGAEGTDQLPVTINATLTEIRVLVEELREGGAVANLNAALQSADDALKSANSALRSVDVAASSLPELARRLNTAADGLQSVVSGYDTQSRFYQDVRGTLGAVSKTAESFRSLARSIERNPSSLIRGR
ncbi:MAG: MlaD family protein [Pseudomonadota bacterium]